MRGGECGVLKELIKFYFKSFTAGPADCLTLKNCQSPHLNTLQRRETFSILEETRRGVQPPNQWSACPHLQKAR